MVIRKETKYGGAERPCALIAVKPIWVSIIGRKTGKDEKLTLQLKYMSYSHSVSLLTEISSMFEQLLTAVNQHFRSRSASPMSFQTMPPTL